MNRLNVYSGIDQPLWQPQHKPKTNGQNGFRVFVDTKLSEHFFICECFINKSECEEIISEFDRQFVQPVGISGYSQCTGKEIGSYRANAWSVSLAESFTKDFRSLLGSDQMFIPKNETLLPTFKNVAGEISTMPVDAKEYRFLGPTPFLRYMKYPGGGRHVPHYDAPFVNPTYRYTTLFSWVLYLNTPEGRGGDFQFIDDGQWNLHPLKKNRSDWSEMASKEKVLNFVQPKQGLLLMFPHWLPHQVQQFEAEFEKWRYVIRGDIAYEW